MIKQFTLLTLSIYICTILCAQTTFEKKLGGNGYQDGMALCKTSDGGFAVAGVSTSDTSSYLNVFIMKTDSMGDSLWTKNYGGPSANDFPSAITETYDGGFLISATTYSYSSQAPTLSDWWIIRTDSNGDTLWTKIIRKIGNDRTWNISENSDHTILCCGWTSTSGWAKGTLMKFTENGDSLWSVQIGSSGNSYSQVCKEDYNGNYLVAGATLNGTYNAIVSEFDTAGNNIASHLYDKTITAEIINSIEHLPQGGYLMSAKSGTTSGFDVWVLRTNDLWDTVWTKTFNDSISMNNIEEHFAFDVVGDSGFVFGGMKLGTTDMEAVLYRFDSTGNFKWSSTFGTIGDDKADDILSLNDGGFVFSGYTASLTNASTDCYLVRTDVNGLLSSTTNVNLAPYENDFILYPNPTTGILHWQTNSITVNEIRIYSATGQLNYYSNQLGGESIYIYNLKTGIYFVEFITEKSIIRKRLFLNSTFQ